MRRGDATTTAPVWTSCEICPANNCIRKDKTGASEKRRQRDALKYDQNDAGWLLGGPRTFDTMGLHKQTLRYAAPGWTRHS